MWAIVVGAAVALYSANQQRAQSNKAARKERRRLNKLNASDRLLDASRLRTAGIKEEQRRADATRELDTRTAGAKATYATNSRDANTFFASQESLRRQDTNRAQKQRQTNFENVVVAQDNNTRANYAAIQSQGDNIRRNQATNTTNLVGRNNQRMQSAADIRNQVVGSNEAQSEFAQDQLEFSVEQYDRWGELFGDAQDNLRNYFKTLTADSLATENISIFQKRFQTLEVDLSRRFAAQNVSGGAQAELASARGVSGAETRARIRSQANKDYYDMQQNYINNGRTNPNVSAVNSAMRNVSTVEQANSNRLIEADSNIAQIRDQNNVARQQLVRFNQAETQGQETLLANESARARLERMSGNERNFADYADREERLSSANAAERDRYMQVEWQLRNSRANTINGFATDTANLNANSAINQANLEANSQANQDRINQRDREAQLNYARQTAAAEAQQTAANTQALVNLGTSAIGAYGESQSTSSFDTDPGGWDYDSSASRRRRRIATTSRSRQRNRSRGRKRVAD